jgi:UDPglucose--hexose-1-phosphate uridylyltransferase
MHRQLLHKPDGRELWLYGRGPLDHAGGEVAPMPKGGGAPGASHLRWHPLLGEWIVYAGHRQTRTFLPPPEFDPLAPTTDPESPTEVPAGAWDVAVFENLFPALGKSAPPPASIVDTRPAPGRCEVVVFAQDQRGSLGGLPLDHLELIVEVWADRYRALAARDDIGYVFAFENRGVEVGVTLHHPHGQIYAYPFVPPLAARSIANQADHHQRHKVGLLEGLIARELEDDRRTLFVAERALAWVPAWARWAYEVWVAPRRRAPTLADLDAAERRDLARALQVALRKLDGLWQAPMPYVMSIHQAPTRGSHPYVHAHVEIYPWLRMRGRLKYLAGSEVGAGVFTSDTLPEDKAAELRAVEVTHD